MMMTDDDHDMVRVGNLKVPTVNFMVLNMAFNGKRIAACVSWELKDIQAMHDNL